MKNVPGRKTTLFLISFIFILFLTSLSPNAMGEYFVLTNILETDERRTHPSAVDWDSDGDYDLVIGTFTGRTLLYYENNGSSDFAVSSDFGSIEPYTDAAPFIIDWDQDGNSDIVIGSQDRTEIYQNDGAGNFSVIYLETGPDRSYTPSAIDWDLDGDHDLVIGSDRGTISFYENSGSETFSEVSYFFNKSNEYGSFDIGMESTPIPIDWNGDGYFDLLVGNHDGTLDYFENDGSNNFVRSENFGSIDVGSSSAPTVLDWNSDGNLDVIIGNSSGEVHFYMNDPDGDGSVGIDDCDENNSNRYVGNDETCDTIDNDCDGEVDEDDASDAPTWYLDADLDGFGNTASGETSCLRPSTAYVLTSGDCDDSNSSLSPNTSEVCDGIDNDCDGEIDEDVTTDYYLDSDGDGLGDPTVLEASCSQPNGYVANNLDCDDSDPTKTTSCDDDSASDELSTDESVTESEPSGGTCTLNKNAPGHVRGDFLKSFFLVLLLMLAIRLTPTQSQEPSS